MSGAVALLSVYAFMVWKGTLPLPFKNKLILLKTFKKMSFLRCIVQCCLRLSVVVDQCCIKSNYVRCSHGIRVKD
jgi:hypothetical protein